MVTAYDTFGGKYDSADTESAIELSQANNAYNNAYFGYNHTATEEVCRFYGGIIVEIMGGDNIIDNSYVSYGDTQITLSGNNGTIVPVGGYVGVVVYGGLIFKNMTASDTVDVTTTTINETTGEEESSTTQEDVLKVNNSGLAVYYNDGTTLHTDNNLAANTDAAKAAIYVNPIVGRVINGYAVNETKGATGRFSVTENSKYHDDDETPRSGNVHSLKNHAKHYSIADINKSETNKLDVTAVATASADGNINVPNAQALFILSLITQSCAGTAQTVNDPNSGGTHTDDTVEVSRNDDGNGNITI